MPMVGCPPYALMIFRRFIRGREKCDDLATVDGFENKPRYIQTTTWGFPKMGGTRKWMVCKEKLY